MHVWPRKVVVDVLVALPMSGASRGVQLHVEEGLVRKRGVPSVEVPPSRDLRRRRLIPWVVICVIGERLPARLGSPPMWSSPETADHAEQHRYERHHVGQGLRVGEGVEAQKLAEKDLRGTLQHRKGAAHVLNDCMSEGVHGIQVALARRGTAAGRLATHSLLVRTPPHEAQSLPSPRHRFPCALPAFSNRGRSFARMFWVRWGLQCNEVPPLGWVPWLCSPDVVGVLECDLAFGRPGDILGLDESLPEVAPSPPILSRFLPTFPRPPVSTHHVLDEALWINVWAKTGGMP